MFVTLKKTSKDLKNQLFPPNYAQKMQSIKIQNEQCLSKIIFNSYQNIPDAKTYLTYENKFYVHKGLEKTQVLRTIFQEPQSTTKINGIDNPQKSYFHHARNLHKSNKKIFKKIGHFDKQNKLIDCAVDIKSNPTTKANSRQKSRANSLQASTCCQVLKQCKVSEKWKNIQSQKDNTKKTSYKAETTKIRKVASPQLTKLTRIVMLDWLYELAMQIQLPKQSFYNCIDYIDKFISVKTVTKRQFQKVGLACLFLATKLQTSSHPRIYTFLQAMDHQVDREQLIEQQRNIVNALKFKLNPPTLYQYMTLILFIAKSFKNIYHNIAWINDLPDIDKDSQIYHQIFWILDGVLLEGLLTNLFDKENICLAILYLAIQKVRLRRQNIKQHTPQRPESTLHTENSANLSQSKCATKMFENLHKFSPIDKQKFDISFQCFMSYATTSNKNLKDLEPCFQQLKKWKINRCSCPYGVEYHEELKHIASKK